MIILISPWYEEGPEVPLSNQVHPVIQGSKVPPFSLAISLCRRFEPPSIDNPVYGHSPFLYSFQTSQFWQDFSDNIFTTKYRIKTNKLIWESYVLIFRRLKNNTKCFFTINTYKQHQADI